VSQGTLVADPPQHHCNEEHVMHIKALALAITAGSLPAVPALAQQYLGKDFNRDGKSDILWYHGASGRVNTWLLDGTGVIANPDLSWQVAASTGWQAKGVGDFNSDGNADVLWYHPATGRVNTWLLDGTSVIANPDFSWTVLGSTGWQLKGTGDFNSDGHTDLLWHHPGSGRVNTWLLDGTSVVANPDFSWTVLGSTGWQLKGTGDFNGDGHTDLLWHHPGSGRVNTWLLDGTSVIANPDFAWNVPGASGWVLEGTGDFNQDGHTDLLWRQRSSGRVNTWLLDGTSVVANPDFAWNVPGNSGWEIVSR
jgi:uncharacterized membrane protein